MTIRSSDQISIIDVTDAYSVILTNESYNFPGTVSTAKSGSTTTQIIAMCGASQVAASVTIPEIEKPSGVSVSSDDNSVSPTLTISVTTSVTTGGVVKIPVHIGDITIVKDFTFAIAYTGETGDDAISISITSSNGTIFKNSAISTVLTAHVYKGGVELSDSQISTLGVIKWYKDGGTTAVVTGTTLSISAGDVINKVTYIAQLEG